MNETTGVNRRFRSRRKLLVAIAAIGTVVLLAGLLVWFSAPKNELLTEMPTQQSRLRFLGPLRQPVSVAWQKFRATWIKPPKPVPFTMHRLDGSVGLLGDLGSPLLTNSLGVCVWIVEEKTIQSILKKPGLVQNRSDPFSASPLMRNLGGSYQQSFEIQERSFGGCAVNFVGKISPGMFIGAAGGTVIPPKDHPSLKPFGVRVSVPKGSAVLILGPVTEFNPTLRYFGLFVPE